MEAGLCELAIGNNSEAEKLFKRAYSLKETAYAALWRGVALKRLNNFPEAIEALIPSPINQNRCAQSRNPIDIMVQG